MIGAVTVGSAVDGKPAAIGQFKFAVKNAWLFYDDVADLTPLFSTTIAYHHATNRRPPETQRSKIF
jgi:hypothetical protein